MHAPWRPLPKSAEKTLATAPNIHYTIYSQIRKEQNYETRRGRTPAYHLATGRIRHRWLRGRSKTLHRPSRRRGLYLLAGPPLLATGRILLPLQILFRIRGQLLSHRPAPPDAGGAPHTGGTGRGTAKDALFLRVPTARSGAARPAFPRRGSRQGARCRDGIPRGSPRNRGILPLHDAAPQEREHRLVRLARPRARRGRTVRLGFYPVRILPPVGRDPCLRARAGGIDHRGRPDVRLLRQCRRLCTPEPV